MPSNYFGIGILQYKKDVNIGTLWRSAYNFGASYIFTIGRKYNIQAADTVKSYRQIPVFNYLDKDDFINHLPYNARLVCVELDDSSIPIGNFVHPRQAVYLLGPENGSIPKSLIDRSYACIKIPSARCLNVAVAGSIVMYDRTVKA